MNRKSVAPGNISTTWPMIGLWSTRISGLGTSYPARRKRSPKPDIGITIWMSDMAPATVQLPAVVLGVPSLQLAHRLGRQRGGRSALGHAPDHLHQAPEQQVRGRRPVLPA